MAIVVSKLTAGSNVHLTTSEEANGMYTDFVSQGVIGATTNTSGVAPSTGAFAANAQGTPDTTIAISAGVAYVTGTPTSQNSQTFRVKNSASTNLTISANASGSTKYDWIYIKLDATKLNTPNTAGDDVATIVASRSSSASSDDGTPPTYGKNIAVVTVANGFSTITNSNIRDTRTAASISATAASTSQDWYATGVVPSTVTYNGRRNYSLTITSTDLTGYLSLGMRLKLTRTITAPTQCTSLNGTTQYYSKSSPSGMTFTNNFVVSAWVKLTSYAAADMNIVSRYNGTSGWAFYLAANTGQLRIAGFNAGAANFALSTSSQSIPLNKWVHVAAQLDMSTTSTGTTNNYMLIDGVEVPNVVTRGGTNPVTLVQAGNLEIGSFNGGTSPFPGKIAQAAIYSAKVTEANILASISQGLAGTETSLISAYSFNNSINDLNANANNLTANGSAVATNADSPFAGGVTGTTEYGIITAITFSSNTTISVLVPENYAIPTSGGVSAISYSSARSPYGFLGIESTLSEILMHATFSSTTVAGVDITALTTTVTIPTSKSIRLEAYLQVLKTGSSGDLITITLLEDAVVKQTWSANMPGSNFALMPSIRTPSFKPAAGSHTYKLNIAANAAGTMSVVGSAVFPAFLRVDAIDL